MLVKTKNPENFRIMCAVSLLVDYFCGNQMEGGIELVELYFLFSL